MGHSLQAKGEVEMMAHTLTELLKQATLPCYMEDVDRDEFSRNLLSSIAAVASYLDDRSYLAGEVVTLADFILLECCERIQFITEGQLFEKYRNLNDHHNRMV